MDEDASEPHSHASVEDGHEEPNGDGARDRIPIDTSARASDAENRGDDTDGGETGGTDRETGEEDHRVPESNSTRIEPGSPSLEGTVFVLLGALLTVMILVRLVAMGFGV